MLLMYAPEKKKKKEKKKNAPYILQSSANIAMLFALDCHSIFHPSAKLDTILVDVRRE